MGIELITKNGSITLTKPVGTGGTVDLSNYYTKAETDIAIANAQPDLTNYLTESELEARGYITAIPDEYVTENELSSKGFLTEHQSLDGYATEKYVDDAIANVPTGGITMDDVEAKGYQTEDQVNALIADAMSTLVDGDEVSY